jgi:hypothetical protein
MDKELAMTWSAAELRCIIEADDLKIAPFRDDGITPSTPTWIWCVSVDGDLYVRAYSGRRSRWYQAAIRQRTGQIVAAGTTTSVAFKPVDYEELNARIDDAYRDKYKSSSYLHPMIGSGERAATVKFFSGKCALKEVAFNCRPHNISRGSQCPM